jgi:hypothetical protein
VDFAPLVERLCPFLKADSCKLGEVFESLHGFNAVVHMAVIPAAGLMTEEAPFRTDAEPAFSVFCGGGAADREGRLGFQRDDPRPPR